MLTETVTRSLWERTAQPPAPAYRRLRGYAFDPSLSTQLETALVNEVVFKVPWEDPGALRPGPVGEYLEVVDVDPASGCYYAPVDLNDPHVLAQDGIGPSEGDPKFHQQMVYAVAMVTIRNFERALGRSALWSPQMLSGRAPSSEPGELYVQRLRVYPHALREANAYYSPQKKALLFGYFPASANQPESHLPGGTVFTCLSHDIVAHETTHALLDGMHRRFIEPTSPDALAFHEAFADIVALFQHFSYPEVLRHQIAKTRGDLASQNLLGELAQQFGKAIGHYGALRDAIGHVDPATKKWRPTPPDPEDYARVLEPHARGAIIVAAVFDAFLSIYKSRVADLFRIASSGTGVMPAGALHPDLVNRLASEASKAAQHVLTMCIRALDYCPPVDVNFGDYLRAIITADSDLVPDDDLGYRIAFIEAFRRRGIYPRDVRTLSVESLRWPRPPEQELAKIAPITELLRGLMASARWLKARDDVHRVTGEIRAKLHEFIRTELGDVTGFERVTGLQLRPECPLNDIARVGGRPAFEVHALRPAYRVGPDGDALNQVIVSITQRRRVRPDLVEGSDDWEALGKALGDTDESPDPDGDEDSTSLPPGTASREPRVTFRGGCTLILDLDTLSLRYAIIKRLDSETRVREQLAYVNDIVGRSLYSTYFGSALLTEQEEPFAFLHRQL